jgi:hypothetical protein
MKADIFVLRRNYALVSTYDIAHVVSNIGRVKAFVDYSFGKHHWTVVI